MADTPTKEPKAEVEDAARGGKGPERERRRSGRNGKKSDRDRPGGNRGGGDRDRRDSRGPRRDAGGRGGGFRDQRNEAPLTAGLFAGVADREMPCRIAGCDKTWTWFGTQQIRSLGKPEPKRMCAEHLAQLEGIEDRAMPCRNNYCTNTWLWSRGAQLYQRERQEKLKPPHRLCDACFEEEKTTEDTQLECKIPECRNTWLWPRQAQLRHRAWVRRLQAKIEAEEAEDDAADAAAADAAAAAAKRDEPAEPASEPPESEIATVADVPADVPADTPADAPSASAEPSEAAAGGEAEVASAEPSDPASSTEASEPASEAVAAESEPKPSKKRKRKRRRKRKINDGPPEKLCERCFERMGHLEPIAIPCKVHGCTSTWSWEREGQLRAWAALDAQEHVTELPQPPRRMCNGCFEFVRGRGDREVACGRPDCEKTWTYKTGAQLQDFLAGRTQDPIRLCEDCSRSQFVISSTRGAPVPAGAEVMPCQVAGCTGSWVYAPGMSLSSADPDADEPPTDRMCDDCRTQRGAQARDPRRMQASTDSSEPSSEVDQTNGEAAETAEAEPDPASSDGSAD
ncbi:hypothetical protein [Enhygromyxa salina]|nr:hypothetical protein [Enhygromyxa salina]